MKLTGLTALRSSGRLLAIATVVSNLLAAVPLSRIDNSISQLNYYSHVLFALPTYTLQRKLVIPVAAGFSPLDNRGLMSKHTCPVSQHARSFSALQLHLAAQPRDLFADEV